MNTKILEIEFLDIGNKKSMFKVDNPKENIVEADIEEFANILINNEIFAGSVGKIVSLNKAQIRETKIREII